MALGDVIARLAVSLSLETAAFEKGATLAEKRLEQSRKSFEKFGKRISGIGRTMSIALTAPIAAFGFSAVKAAKESAEAMGQVDAALKSMGDGAGRTAEQLKALATSQMRQSLYDDDEILRKVTANLLTFGSVAEEQFDRAQQAAIDISARMGTDLQSSAIMVGKALNEPTKGLAALRRVGIQFTEQQQEQIKAMVEVGDTAGAQAVMLSELERQFSGSAQAMREADPMAAAKMSFGEFQETIGEKLLPILPVLADAIISVLDAFTSLSPGMQKVVVIGAAVVAAVGPILTVFGGLISVGGPLISLLAKLGPLLGIVGKALLFIAANPVILGLAAVIGGIYLAWKYWDEIVAILQRVWAAVKRYVVMAIQTALETSLGPISAIYLAWKHWDKIEPIIRGLYNAVKNWLQDKLGAIWDWIIGKLKAVGAAFAWLYDVVVGNSYIPDLVDGIAAEMARLDAVMVAPIEKATTKAQKAFRDMASDIRSVLDRLFPGAAAQLQYEADRALLANIADPEARFQALRELARQRGRQQYDERMAGRTVIDAEPLDKMGEGIDRFNERMEGMLKKSQDVTVRVAKSFKDMVDQTLSALGRLSDSIKGGNFLDILEAVVGLGIQLGSIGAFGKGIAGRINATVPGYAAGTNFHPGGLAIVGERGPELVSMPRGSRVHSNDNMRGMTSRVEIVDTTGLFRFRVDGQIMDAAPSIANAGGQVGVAKMQKHQSRRWR